MKPRAERISNRDPVASLSLDHDDNISNDNDQGGLDDQNDNNNGNSSQEDQNESIIEHLKKQIDLLVTQLESVEREDSKIIGELSDKIDNIAKMNSVSRLFFYAILIYFKT